jgi:hypothetical protein
VTPLELERIGKRMYGPHRWRSQLALNLGLNVSTIWRMSKREDIPHLVEVAVRGLLERHKVNVVAEKSVVEQLRKEGRLRPKLKRKKGKKNGRPKKVVGDVGNSGSAGISTDDVVDPALTPLPDV